MVRIPGQSQWNNPTVEPEHRLYFPYTVDTKKHIERKRQFLLRELSVLVAPHHPPGISLIQRRQTIATVT